MGRTRETRVGRGLAVLTLAVLGLSGCGSDDPVVADGAAASTNPAVTTSTPATTAPSESPSESAPTAATTSPSSTTSSSTSSSASPSRTPSPSSSALRWPRSLGEPQQAASVYAVYLAVAHTSEDAAITKAVANAAKVDYEAVVGDLACDRGGVEGLKLDAFEYWSAATVYFATKADAQTFAASFTSAVAKPRGVVKVSLGCLD